MLKMAAAQRLATESKVALSIVRMVFILFPFGVVFAYGYFRVKRSMPLAACDELQNLWSRMQKQRTEVWWPGGEYIWNIADEGLAQVSYDAFLDCFVAAVSGL
jgi:hypothetical protein